MTEPPRSTPKAWLWRYHLQNTGNIVLDRVLGIDTAGWVDIDELGFGPDDGIGYQPSNWVNLVALRSVLRGMGISDRDEFIDYGCGKGQVIALAARFPFRRVIGLDLSAKMISVAERNAARLRSKARCGAIEFVNMNALDYELPDGVTVCYFYMPFPTPIFERVMARIASSVSRAARKIHVIYLRPTVDEIVILRRHGFTEVSRQRSLTAFTN